MSLSNLPAITDNAYKNIFDKLTGFDLPLLKFLHPSGLNLDLAKILFSRSTEEYFIWNQLWQFIDYTRSYQLGLDIVLRLLELIEENKNDFDDYDYCVSSSGYMFFEMLDRMDRREEYLENWSIIKTNIRASNTGYYTRESKESHFSDGAEEYLIEDSGKGIKFHFLYGLNDRMQLIKRKLEKKEKGHKIGNLLHEQQSDLTDEELKERVIWILKYLSTGEYDYDPPASKQKQKRRQENKRTIDL